MKDQGFPSPDAADETDGDRQRGHGRDSLMLVGRLTLAGDRQPHEVRIRNLSARGLMVELGRPVATGTALTIEMRGIGKVAGQVAWYVDGRIGVSLDTPIDPQQARKPIGNGSRTPLYARPAFG